MPHVDIFCLPGRNDELKTKLANKVAEDVADIFSTEVEHISVAIREVTMEDWKDKVIDAKIAGQEKDIYKTAIPR